MAASSTVKVTYLGDAAALAKASKIAQDAVDKVSGSVGRAAKVGSFLGSAAGNLATSALGKVQSFATGAVDAFSAVEDAGGAASVLFGQSLPSVVKFADEAAAAFGLSKRQALEAQNTFGTFGKLAGLTGNDLSGFSQQLTGLAGDLASFKGTSTEQAITAVGAALRGESEPIRAYGVMLDDATLKAQALADGLIKPAVNADKVTAAAIKVTEKTKAFTQAVKEHGKNSVEAVKAENELALAKGRLTAASEGTLPSLTASQKVMAAQAAILKQTKDAQGDYNRTSDSTANVQKTLAAETENAQAKLGKQLAPAVTAVRKAWLGAIRSMSGAANIISKVSGLVQGNKTTLTVVAGVIGTLLIPTLARLAVQYTVTGAAAVVSGAKQLAAWVAAQAGALASAAVQVASCARVVAGWVLMGVQATLQAARMAAAWLIAMGPIAIVIAAVVGLVVLIVKNWDTIKRATAAAFNWVWTKVKQVFGFLKNLFLNFTGPGLIIKHFNKIVGFVKAMPGRIKSAAVGMFDGIKDAFKAAINWLIRKWNDFSIGIPAVDTHIPGVGKVGGFSLDTPDIPELAKGGIVKARPGGTIVRVAEAGQDEAVVPLPRGAQGGGGQQLVVNLQLDGQTIQTSLLRLKRLRGGGLGLA